MATSQRKQRGIIQDFSGNVEIELQRYTFREDIFGIYAYQREPVTVDATIRNALLSGDMANVENDVWGQGMALRYAQITWNETQQGDKYYITDFAVGVVVKANRDYNTGPAYLIDVLHKIPWLAQFTIKIEPFPWKAWKLLTPTRNVAYNHWVYESESPSITVNRAIIVPLPDLPTAESVKTTMLTQGRINEALGTFTTKMLEKGFSVTFPANSYGIDICFEKTPDVVDLIPITHSYTYRVHVRFWWDFSTNPEFTTDEAKNVSALWVQLAVAAVILIILAVGASYAIANATSTHTEYTKFEVLRDANGNPILDQNGNPIIYASEKGSSQTPADFMAWVIPAVVLIGAGVAAFGIYQILPRRRRE